MGRRLAAALALLALSGLPACAGAEREQRSAAKARFATPERSVPSPSGRYRLAVVRGEYSGADGTGEFWRIQIRDRHGRLELDSRERFRTEVLWDERRDRPWVASSDVGTSYWERDHDGRWKVQGLSPETIWRARPPPPRLLVKLHPEDYGAEGRADAKRLFEEQGSLKESFDTNKPHDPPLKGDPDPGISDDDPRLMKP